MELFAGRGAVITGGASGIGLACARELGARGASLVLADVEPAALASAVADLAGAGVNATGVVCDVRSLTDVEQLADKAFDFLDTVNLVFNNAGVSHVGPVEQVTHDDWRWVIDVDLWGPIHGVEAFLPRLIEQGIGGHLVFTASFAGLVPNIALGPYCVAKYGVVALAEVLARELRPHSIGVSVLCPMLVDTNIGTSERNRPSEYGEARQPVPPPAEPGDAPAASSAGPQLDVLSADEVARLTIDAIVAGRLYVLPHEASRKSIRRRFERIDRVFDEQPPLR